MLGKRKTFFRKNKDYLLDRECITLPNTSIKILSGARGFMFTKNMKTISLVTDWWHAIEQLKKFQRLKRIQQFDGLYVLNLPTYIDMSLPIIYLKIPSTTMSQRKYFNLWQKPIKQIIDTLASKSLYNTIIEEDGSDEQDLST